MRTALCVLFFSGVVAAHADLVFDDERSKDITGGSEQIPNAVSLIKTDIPPSSETKASLKDFVPKDVEGGPKLKVEEENSNGRESEIFIDEDKGRDQLHKHEQGGDPPPPVPEPTSIATFGSGVLILAFYTRRRCRDSRPYGPSR